MEQRVIDVLRYMIDGRGGGPTRFACPPPFAFGHRLILLIVLALLLACGDGRPTEPVAPVPAPASLTIIPQSTTLAALGQTVQLTATVRDQTGTPMTGVALNWASSDGGVAIVSASGLVTAVGNGSASVTAAVQGGGPSAAIAVTVAQQVAELRLPSTIGVFRALGDTARLSAEALDANGSAVPDIAFTWSSSDPSVVAVDESGLVTAVGNGTASVTAASGSTTASTDFTVEQQVMVIRLSPAAGTLREFGDTLRLSVLALDANDYAIEGVPFMWSSSDEFVATVDASGLVTTENSGTVHITVGLMDTGVTAVTTLVVLSRAREILIEVYNTTNGPNWPWPWGARWLSDAPLGLWQGVTTDERGRVTGLKLYGLQGRIPAVLGDLRSLRTLDMSSEELTGPIPPELSKLVNLEVLELSWSNLTGTIPPELGNLENLTGLLLWGNNLWGPIPEQLSSLTKLQVLSLRWNDLTGPLPAWLGSLSHLKTLALGSNHLRGPIPAELRNLTGLEELDLGSNPLTGGIPAWTGAFQNLRVLRLDRGGLTGSIPPELGNLSNLEKLFLDENDLTGPIPVEFRNLSSLYELWLRGNALTGPIPTELTELTGLGRLFLERNALTGPIPAEIGRLVNLIHLTLGTNDFTGPIPRELGSLTRLWLLDLSDTKLTGPIPSELASLTNLARLYLNDSDLAGPIPQGFINIPLREFNWSGTMLCAPANDAFQSWVRGIETHVGGANCSSTK